MSCFIFLVIYLLAGPFVTQPLALETGIEKAPSAQNGAKPSEGIQTIELKEIWRAGGDDDDHFFGVISDVLADANGDIYLADKQLNQVFVYNAEGDFLRILSREGEGPGEVREPGDLLFMPGGELGIVHRAVGEVTCINRDGTPQSSYRLKTNQGLPLAQASVYEAKRAGGNLVLCGRKRVESDELNDHEKFLSVFSPDGTEGKKLASNTGRGFNFEKRSYVEIEDYFANVSGWTTSPTGEIYFAPAWEKYLIYVFAADGSPIRSISREYKARKRTGEDIKRIEDSRSMHINGERVQMKMDIDERDHCIQKLHVDESGKLWVQHSRSTTDQPEGVMFTYDIFDETGRYIYQRQIICDGDPAADALYLLPGNRFVLLKGIVPAINTFYQFSANPDEDDEVKPLEVVCFQGIRG